VRNGRRRIGGPTNSAAGLDVVGTATCRAPACDAKRKEILKGGKRETILVSGRRANTREIASSAGEWSWRKSHDQKNLRFDVRSIGNWEGGWTPLHRPLPVHFSAGTNNREKRRARGIMRDKGSGLLCSSYELRARKTTFSENEKAKELSKTPSRIWSGLS